MREVTASLHVQEGNVLQFLKFDSLEALKYEIQYITQFVKEEMLFKVGLSVLAGRSVAKKLKKIDKSSELLRETPKISPEKRDNCIEAPSKKKKKRKAVFDDGSPNKIPITEEVLNHTCTGCQQLE